MNETHTTVRGTVITDPTTRRVGEDSVFSFRVASNTRYQDRDSGEWKTGGTLYFSANCWGRLAQRASGKLVKGDGVIVQGRLLTNEYEKDGRIQRDLEMRVTALGPDLSRMDVAIGGRVPYAVKVHGSEFYIEAYRRLMEVVGSNAILGHDLERWMRSTLVLTFGGGTNEIQRDIIAMVGLGMPRAPR